MNKCFACFKNSIGTRTITNMGGFALRHGPIKVPHCGDHAAPKDTKSFVVSNLVPCPFPDPPTFWIERKIEITDEDIEKAKKDEE